MQNLLSNIKKDYDIPEIEAALIKQFLKISNLTNVKSNVINELLGKDTDDKLTDLILKLGNLDIFSLVNYFELLVLYRDRKLNGAFPTPQFITKFMIDSVLTDKKQFVCDPSCGRGAFLISLALAYKEKFKSKIYTVIEKNIFGCDISEHSIQGAKVLLTLLCLINKEKVNDIHFNLLVNDSLKTNLLTAFNGKVQQGFDLVIGNPPYVKFQDLDDITRKELFNNWETLKVGTYNLYFAFFELGIKILKQDGTLCYITPNNYFTSLAAIELRKYLHSNKLLFKIIDFNHLKVFKAQTYTCISYLSKKNNDQIEYDRIESKTQYNHLDKLNYSIIDLKSLNNKKWRLLKKKDQDNIKKIESYPKLGELVNIRVGIATCKDVIYFLDGKTENNYYVKIYNNKKYLIEKKITRPVAKISDFKTQEDLNNNKRQIIFPYTKVKGEYVLITKLDLEKEYPECYKYFVDVKNDLLERDKGKQIYNEWYSYARSQAFNYVGKKLYTPTFSSEPRFLFEENVERLFCNGYGIFNKENENLFNSNGVYELEILQKILNSRIMDYYVKQTSVAIEGGYPCYQKNFIELFGIPEFTVEEVLELKKEKNIEKINEYLIDKYKIAI